MLESIGWNQQGTLKARDRQNILGVKGFARAHFIVSIDNATIRHISQVMSEFMTLSDISNITLQVV